MKKALPLIPRHEWLLLTRERGFKLPDVVNVGLKVEPSWGKVPVLVEFSPLGQPFKWGDTGWTAQRLESNFGGKCVVLVEPEKDNLVTGLIRLRPYKGRA